MFLQENFIIKLFKLTKLIKEIIHDFILMIIDQLIKYIYIILFKEIYVAEQLKYVILNKLI